MFEGTDFFGAFFFMRFTRLKKLSIHGGHCGPNFGMVEATIALHYVFNSPVDKFVFDVSHQTYPHKMLTGRAYGFLDESRYDDITGYSCPEESEHDFFTVGHTSTSVSLACGLAKTEANLFTVFTVHLSKELMTSFRKTFVSIITVQQLSFMPLPFSV